MKFKEDKLYGMNGEYFNMLLEIVDMLTSPRVVPTNRERAIFDIIEGEILPNVGLIVSIKDIK